LSYNFDYSKNTNQTFDVPTYGTSANGIEGPSKISVINANHYTTISSNKLTKHTSATSEKSGRERLLHPRSRRTRQWDSDHLPFWQSVLSQSKR